MLSVCFISDVHNNYKKLILPDADVIVCAGDMTSVGKEHEVRNFMKWFSALDQYIYKVFIAGNHDWLFETSRVYAKELIPKNIIYLEDSGIEIEGLYFYGTPVNIEFCNWAFNRTEQKLSEHWKAIPEHTDVLITHNPAYSVLDQSIRGNMLSENYGSPSLYNEVLYRVKPLVHVCGHIHSGHGVEIIDNTTFINASVLNESYEIAYEPVLVEINNKEVKIIQK